MTDLNKDSGHEGPEETAEETVQASQAAGGTAGKQDKRNGRFSMGVLAGALGAVIIICGAAGLWKAVTGMFTGDYTSGTVSEADVNEKLDKINGLIEEYYLYDDEVDEDTLIDGIYSGYAEALGDPYTEYYDEEETKALYESTSGEFSGIGATMSKSLDSDEITVSNVYEDSPAEKAGLKQGDIIYQVDDHSVSGQDLETVVSWIKGEQGTDVVLHVIRGGEELELTATRDIVEVQTVTSEMKDGLTGYIGVSEFDSVTYDQFEEALGDLEAQGMQGLVIDLRGNPGGLLSAVCDTLRQILPEGLIVYTEDKQGDREEYTCDGETPLDIPLVVLVNENSASAAEIFTGAVKDYGIGAIVGQQTFGKGIVQDFYGLPDGSVVKLTVAHYYTPNGNDIHGVGIAPDVTVEQPEDSETDVQLQKALEVLRAM